KNRGIRHRQTMERNWNCRPPGCQGGIGLLLYCLPGHKSPVSRLRRCIPNFCNHCSLRFSSTRNARLQGSETRRLDIRCREASAPNRPYWRALPRHATVAALTRLGGVIWCDAELSRACREPRYVDQRPPEASARARYDDANRPTRLLTHGVVDAAERRFSQRP